MNVVSHPLWKFNNSGTDSLSLELINLATSHGVSTMRLIDSFNLSRRMSWVKGNLSYFPIIMITSLQQSPSDDSQVSWMKSLHAMEIGSSIEHEGRKWVRCASQDAWTSPDGVWLVSIDEQTIYDVTIRNIAGAGGVRIKRRGQGNPNLLREQYTELKVFARREE